MNAAPAKMPERAAAFVLDVALVLSLGGLATAVLIQVVARYVLNAPPFWTEELARFLLIWLTFMGALAAHRDGEHISVTWLPEMLGPRGRHLQALLCHALVLAVLLIITKAGADITRTGRQTAPALGISMAWFYAALPVASGLMALVSLLRVWQALRALAGGIRP